MGLDVRSVFPPSGDVCGLMIQRFPELAFKAGQVFIHEDDFPATHEQDSPCPLAFRQELVGRLDNANSWRIFCQLHPRKTVVDP